MAGLDFLTQGGSAAINQNQAAQTTLPDWYNSYIQGIAGKATSIAQNPYVAYPGQRTADFNDDQQNAFQQVRDATNNYQPQLSNASSILNAATPQVQGALGQVSGDASAAQGAVAGPSQSWTDPGVAQKYMSPYTQSVTDEIGRLGNQNLQENIVPGVMSNFVGSGQFGSSRNATILGQAVRDAQTNISGLQSTALQSGYTGAQAAFGADANRAQGQQSLQAQTDLGAGNLNVSAANAGASTAGQLASQQGALGQLTQTLGNNQATALGAVGGQEQGLEQTGYDKSYNDFLTQQGWDWSQLGKVQGAVQGAQLPTGTTASTSASSTPAGTSPLAWVNAIGGLYNASQSSP